MAPTQVPPPPANTADFGATGRSDGPEPFPGWPEPPRQAEDGPRKRGAHDPEEPAALPVVLTRLLLGVGRTFMTLGVLLLLFAGFQLWGTGLTEARAQADLTERFNQQLLERAEARMADAALVGPTDGSAAPATDRPDPLVVDVPDSSGSDSSGSESPGSESPSFDSPVEATVVEASLVRPEIGDPIGVLQIPTIGVEKTFAYGTTRDVLRAGPGLYPSTPLPGQPGNVAIAGHRTTHGAPFFDIDKLQPGDEISIDTVDGTYIYTVEGQPGFDGGLIGHRIVAPEDVEVIMDQGDDRLTLTACHPKYSARQRIFVTSVLTSVPESPTLLASVTDATEADPSPAAVPAPMPQPATDLTELPAIDELAAEGPALGTESLGWQAAYGPPAAAWGLLTGLIGLAGWGLGRRWRRLPAYAAALPPATLTLYYCFVNLERFIPAV